MFSRTTIIKTVSTLQLQIHAEVNKFALEFGLEDVISGSYIKEKGAAIMRYLIKNPQAKAPNGTPLAQAIIDHLVLTRCQVSDPAELFPELVNSLDRDGYKLDRNGLRAKLPSQLPLVEEENELIDILDRYGYSVAKGHYEQAVAAHTRGDWAASNSQLRSFVEEFFNRVAETVVPGSYSSSHQCQQALAKAGFFQSDLNEWLDEGKGFVQGFWRRLHPQGSHPGLSEKEDSTFRLHVVIVVTHYFAKRLESQLNGIT
ncbi:MAG: hypothetical protein COX20_07290 [Desulfobacterales bacterium CG23_combo_of_CG06-09_8_20_14_all_52_9]|nr:MAG: hypothetical protein COX20_07290 [Desulfobacterales bacterium CG23_combo_of_CG06-09_8_20_14_all_52_9]